MSFAAEANARLREIVVGMLEKNVAEGRVPAAEYDIRKKNIEEISKESAANSQSASLTARDLGDEQPKYCSTVVAREDDSPVEYHSTVAVAHGGGLDSVEWSLQTIEAYLDTLKEHLPATAQCFHELGLESYREFKKNLHRGEDALVRAYGLPAPSATPATPANPSASPIVDLVQAANAAVEEVMAGST